MVSIIFASRNAPKKRPPSCPPLYSNPAPAPIIPPDDIGVHTIRPHIRLAAGKQPLLTERKPALRQYPPKQTEYDKKQQSMRSVNKDRSHRQLQRRSSAAPVLYIAVIYNKMIRPARGGVQHLPLSLANDSHIRFAGDRMSCFRAYSVLHLFLRLQRYQ